DAGPTRRTARHSLAEATRQLAEAKPRLVVVSGMLLGLQVELRDEPIIVGRAPECGISLQHPSVSRNHCRIWREDDAFWIEDCGSTNHTYLNCAAVARRQLRDSDKVSVGGNAIKFVPCSSLEASSHNGLLDLAL